VFKIGDFAQLGRVSTKMLRHYDEIGLLKPAYIHPSNDYRYYAADQLPRLNRIIVLKELGFTLQQIGALLDDGLPLELLQGMLLRKQAEVEQQLATEQQRLAQIAARLAQIAQEGRQPRYEVLVCAVEQLRVAAATTSVASEEVQRMACLVFAGTDQEVGVAYAALAHWVEAGGYEIARPYREVYLQGGLVDTSSSPHPEQSYVIEIQFPLAPLG